MSYQEKRVVSSPRGFAVMLFCRHCRESACYSYPLGTRLWWGYLWRMRMRTWTLKHTKCGRCGVVGELR